MERNVLAGAYIRLSNEDKDKEEQEVSISILNQINLITEFAKQKGIIIVQKYIDDRI